MTITINGTTGIAGVDGSAGTPAVQGTDTNTGIFFPAADTIAFGEGGAEVARFDSNGRLGIGTSSPSYKLQVNTDGVMFGDAGTFRMRFDATDVLFLNGSGGTTERARIDSDGGFLVGKTIDSSSTAGSVIRASGQAVLVVDAESPLRVNRLTNDGNLVEFFQATSLEGSISVSGSTVSYNGGHLSRWAQMPGTKDDTLVKGTVMSNLDEMNVYTKTESQ